MTLTNAMPLAWDLGTFLQNATKTLRQFKNDKLNSDLKYLLFSSSLSLINDSINFLL